MLAGRANNKKKNKKNSASGLRFKTNQVTDVTVGTGAAPVADGSTERILISGGMLMLVFPLLYMFRRSNRGWRRDGECAGGRQPPLWDKLITLRERMVIRGEAGGQKGPTGFES